MGGMGATLGVGLVHTGIMKGFISYAHEDLDLVTDFRKHLAEVERGYDLPFWADDSILAGHDWNDRIAAAIADAHVFLLMLSPSFFNSSYIRTTEIPAIHARLRAIGGLVCPILLIRCPWERQLGNVQVIPRNSRRLTPIIEWRPQDNGHDAARNQLDAAIRAHFNLIPKSEYWFTPLLNDTPDLPGPIWVEAAQKFDLDPSGADSDARAAADPITQQLHAANRPKAIALAANVARLANSLGREWDGFIAAARKLAEVIDRDTSELPDMVATLWEASVGLASFLDFDKRIRDTRPNDMDNLPPDIHRALDDLVGSVAPWVRRFPTAEGLDDARGAFLTNPALFAPAKRLFEAAVAENLTTAQATEAMAASFATAERGGTQADKARVYAMRGGFGLLRKFARAAGTTLLSGAIGAFMGSAIDQSVRMKAIGAVFGRAGDIALEMAAALPADSANGLRRLIRRAGKPDFPYGDGGEDDAPGVPLAVPQSAPPLPDDFIEEAHRLILRGEAPPPEWRRFITALDFGPNGGLGVERTRLTDLSALAGLTALQSLDLTGTQVVDLSALAGLTTLQSLSVMDTPVADLSALAGLTALQSLDLMHTPVVDLSVLAGLTALQRLDLYGTQVADLSALAGLTALQSLAIGDTLVADLSVLTGLTALQSLDLWGTPVTDLSALAGLTALQSLDLGGTPVTDLSALAGLTALKKLFFRDPKVIDVIVLSHLKHLEIIVTAPARAPRHKPKRR